MRHSDFASSVCLLLDPVLLQLLVEIAARRADDLSGLRDVPVVLAQLADEERALGRFLELSQRAALTFLFTLGAALAFASGRTISREIVDVDDLAGVMMISRSTVFLQLADVPFPSCALQYSIAAGVNRCGRRLLSRLNRSAK